MSTNNPQVQTSSDEEQIVDTPQISSHIDFVFMDHHLHQDWRSRTATQIVQFDGANSTCDVSNGSRVPPSTLQPSNQRMCQV